MNKYKDQIFKNINLLIELLECENKKQINKWNIQERTSFEWLTYITEEVGELAESISEFEYRDGSKENVVKEAIHSATLCLKVAEMFLTLKDNKND